MNLKKWMGLLMKKAVMMPCMAISGADLPCEDSRILADWKLDSKYFKSGSLETNDLVIKDASGHGNDLQLNTARVAPGKTAADYLEFKTDNIQGSDTVQSLKLTPEATKVGAFLETVKGSPILWETFEEGYTIEAILKVEPTFIPWSGIFVQKGTAKLAGLVGDEPESSGGLNLSESNELQWNPWTVNNAEVQTNPTSWSDADGLTPNQWHHVAIKNNGHHTVMVLDGIKVLRCNMYEEQVGLAALGSEEDRAWVIGTAYWSDADEFSEAACGDAMFRGSIQEIRMSRGLLDPKDYLVVPDLSHFPLAIKGNNNPYKPLDRKNNYTFAVLPDPQYTTQYKPEITTSETEWIRDNKDRLNIAMTMCVGDVTQSGCAMEYDNSDLAFRVLDEAGLPYIVIDGNHDSGNERKRSLYLEHFGPQRYQPMPEYRGSAPSGISAYFTVRAGSYEYLIVTLPWNDEDVEMDRAWVENILKAHPENPTIVMSHFNEDLSFVTPYDQVFMTIRGHVDFRDARILKNDAGHDVIDIVVNYQFDPYGGNGWLRTLEFDEEAGMVLSQSYSPWVEKKMKILNGEMENNGILPQDEMLLFPFDMLNITTHPSDTASFRLNFSERFAKMKKFTDD